MIVYSSVRQTRTQMQTRNTARRDGSGGARTREGQVGEQVVAAVLAAVGVEISCPRRGVAPRQRLLLRCRISRVLLVACRQVGSHGAGGAALAPLFLVTAVAAVHPLRGAVAVVVDAHLPG